MKRRDSGFDPQRVLAAALQAYLGGEPRAGRPAAEEQDGHAPRRAGGGAVALGVGVGIGIGARALYRRARRLDLERVARAVERRLVN